MRALLFALLLSVPFDAHAQKREVGQLVYDGIPEVPREIHERMSQYQNVRGASLYDWHPQGKGVLIGTRFADTVQAHLVESPGAARRQLTFFDEPVRAAQFDPAGDGSGLLYVKDVGGGEFYQFFWLDRATGKSRLLTDGKSRNESPLFAHKGGRFAFVSTRRNGTDFDLYVQRVDEQQPKLLQELKGHWSVLDWSPDDGQLLLFHDVSINDSYLHLLDLATGQLRELVPHPGKLVAMAESAAFDGEGAVLYASDEGGEFLQLTRLELASGKKTLLAPKIPWDVTQVSVSRDGRWLAYAANEGGTSALYLASMAKAAEAQRIALPKGVLTALRFDLQSARLGLSLNAATAPDDVYSVDLKSRQLVRWTFSEVGGLDPQSFVAPDLVQFPSFDGRQIPAWYYRPRKAQGPAPVIINIHGGPEAQATAYFNPSAQYYVNELGAAVIFPNVRGSAGYGKTYLLLDNGMKREESVQDIGALLDWIATRPELDKTRVAVIGGSYGGFMSLATLAKYADRLRCAVDVVGISHFVTFLEHTEGYRRDLRRVEYGDEREPQMRALLEKISPLTNAAKMTKPLFVAQGANDPRVPASEAEQIVKAVRQNGAPVWYLLAKDEGHGFNKKRNRDAYLDVTSLFFERFLLPPTPAQEPAAH